MTKRGIRCLIVFALLLLLALATGLSEIFLVVFCLGIVFAFALISATAGVFAMQVKYILPDNIVVRGDTAPFGLYFSGTVLLPVIVRIKLIYPTNNRRQCAALFWGKNHKSLFYRSLCSHRGLWTFGIESAHSCDVFGFFSLTISKRKLSHAFASVTVYPRVYDIPGTPPPPTPTMDYNEYNPIISDSGDSFTDTRLYRDGDPLKRIHWKLSMRTQKLHTRKYEMSVDRMVGIVIDTNEMSDNLFETLNYADMAAECAASLTSFFSDGGHTVRICPSGDFSGAIIYTKNEFSLANKLLATTEFGTNESIETTIHNLLNDIYYFSFFYVITPTPSSNLIDSLSRLTSMQCNVSIIYPDATQPASACDAAYNGVNLIAIARPQNIPERLGESI
ncbi:MAG TPA: hypothetical protein DEB10_14490 [Ruminococcaceae bacterium]|nr:hypothetical protein [Oscillospiraceae bacterium]